MVSKSTSGDLGDNSRLIVALKSSPLAPSSLVRVYSLEDGGFLCNDAMPVYNYASWKVFAAFGFCFI